MKTITDERLAELNGMNKERLRVSEILWLYDRYGVAPVVEGGRLARFEREEEHGG